MQAISIDFEILSRAEIRCSSRGCFVRVKMKQPNSRGLPAGGGGEIPGRVFCIVCLSCSGVEGRRRSDAGSNSDRIHPLDGGSLEWQLQPRTAPPAWMLQHSFSNPLRLDSPTPSCDRPALQNSRVGNAQMRSSVCPHLAGPVLTPSPHRSRTRPVKRTTVCHGADPTSILAQRLPSEIRGNRRARSGIQADGTVPLHKLNV